MREYIQSLKDRDKFEVDAIENAIVNLNAIPLGNDLFLLPDYCMVSGSSDCCAFEEEIGKGEDYLEKEVIEEINKLVDKDCTELLILLIDEDENGEKLLRITNPKSQKAFDLKIKTEYGEKERYTLVGMIASALKVNDIKVNTKLFADFKMIEHIYDNQEMCFDLRFGD